MNLHYAYINVYNQFLTNKLIRYSNLVQINHSALVIFKIPNKYKHTMKIGIHKYNMIPKLTWKKYYNESFEVKEKDKTMKGCNSANFELTIYTYLYSLARHVYVVV